MRIAGLAMGIATLSACVPEGGVIPWPGLWDYADGGVLDTTCPDDLYRDADPARCAGGSMSPSETRR